MKALTLLLGEIHLWFARCDDVADDLLRFYRELLAAEEAKQEMKFYFPHDQRRYLVTRAMVRIILSRYYPAINPRDWMFSLNAFGRPELASDHFAVTGLSFNISHTQGLIALAVARHRRLGVDIENVHARTISIDIADQFFSRVEIASLADTPKRMQQFRFFEYWTLKEAYIKARGMGLSLPLNQFSFHYPQDGIVEMTIQQDLRDDPSRWQLWQFRPVPEVLVALCAERTEVGTLQRLMFRNVVPGVEEQEISLEPTRRSLEIGRGA
ncbi:4'-phosphopantetheinyl transferase family protein [Bradyrhizobium elkanii]|uniref:4'-phosphopantetheinyl transferase family protein n=1 Tax=Bradyrhizobium elkanii TaxID=29448 RepID=UPI001BA5A7A1|nr:4'-phosphopantetheinyl transferase superfamily protein [Bradyrhizobium elkanii]MBR1158102.1 4'-phosphopantetheinyl transferase superfamily protein [Bradyrhizobium elkanii]